ncbi:MAG: GDSL-type esterase/lipase family protein [Bryobacteraceae bacterium]
MQRRAFLGTIPALAQSPAADSFAPVRALLTGKEPLTWVFTGDSITHGALHTFGWRSYVEHFSERIRFEMARPQDIVINTGISGDTTAGLLKRFGWRVARFQPSVVSLMMGMNDCGKGPGGREMFRANLEELVSKISATGSKLILHTMNTIVEINSGASRKDLPAYVAIIRELAAKHGLPLVDHYKHWAETRTGRKDVLYLLNDGSIHPNNVGHVAMAHLLFRELGIFDSESQVCRLFVP